MPFRYHTRIDAQGNVSQVPYEISEAEARREAAEVSLRGVRQAIRSELAEAQADRDAVAGADLGGLRTLMRRLIARQISALRRERAALLLTNLDGDDGEA